MAIMHGNILMQGVSGSFDKQIVFRNYGGKMRVSTYPDMSKRKLTPKQIRTNEIMREAIYKAKEVLYYEDKRNAAQIRLNLPSNKLYNALKKEFLAELYQKEAEKKSDAK